MDLEADPDLTDGHAVQVTGLVDTHTDELHQTPLQWTTTVTMSSEAAGFVTGYFFDVTQGR